MIKKIKNSLSAKVFLLTTVVLIIISAVTYIFIAFSVPSAYSSKLDKELENKADKLIDKLKQSTKEEGEQLIEAFSKQTGALVFVQYPDEGIFIEPSGKSENGTFDVHESYINNGLMQPDIASEELSTIQYPFRYIDTEMDCVLQISGESQTVNQVVEAMLTVLPWLICLILLLSGMIAYVYSRVITRPVLEISKISRNMSMMEFDWKCDEFRTDEIGLLSKSLNELSEKLSSALKNLKEANKKLKNEIENEKASERQRMEFFSAVSHELKTPVTILKGQLEGMIYKVGSYQNRDQYLKKALKVTSDMEQMVYEILDIARFESSEVTFENEKFDFSEIVRRNLSIYIELMEKKNICYHIDIEEHIDMYSDRKAISKVVGNLMSNAINYSPKSAQIYICAGVNQGVIDFSIENTGVHIKEDALEHVFEAFYRTDQSRNRKTGGSGLGLYLVSRILDRCNGKYDLKNTPCGVKVSFSIKQKPIDME